MKKTIKVFSIILIASIIVLFLSTNVFAAADIIGSITPDYSNTDTNGLQGVGQTIISYISIAGIIISVIVLLILGIKYMIGSASEKAEYKKTMIPYLVGAVIIFGASAIAQVVVQMASAIVPT